MDLALLIDFGSTYTKVTVVDLDREELLATAKGPTTIETNIMDGLNIALAKLYTNFGEHFGSCKKIACSSAAGGLRMVTIGLVPDLTGEAAKKAALGAGAKVVGVYCNKLNREELKEIEILDPDIILLCGGTDGGNRTVISANAEKLASLQINVPIIVAGNKEATDEIQDTLKNAGKDVRITGNVMPEIGVLEVHEIQKVIRDVFIEKIINAKGLKSAEQFVERILMPTPTAVLQAAELLSRGAEGEKGLGELIIVDIGGATTDVYSAASGTPSQGGVITKGLPDPYLKRTVEGDMGMRYSLKGIVEAAGIDNLARDCRQDANKIMNFIATMQEDTEKLPQTEGEMAIEMSLARVAVDVATKRHVGTLNTVYTIMGESLVQYGKDLRDVALVIGTGGVIVFNDDPCKIMDKMVFTASDPSSLKPQKPDLYVDSQYILYAIGLLAEFEPQKALRIAKKYLNPVHLQTSH
ncbi:MAG: methylaspartate mutase accessory protein GlmL [Dehalobacterium sp.]